MHQTELEWRSASLPASYLSYGPPLLACIAKHNCRSIAVASSSGVCILDASMEKKWKRFDAMDETKFQILAFHWWEGEDDEDLLLTVVETIKNQKRHLACWSRKR